MIRTRGLWIEAYFCIKFSSEEFGSILTRSQKIQTQDDLVEGADATPSLSPLPPPNTHKQKIDVSIVVIE